MQPIMTPDRHISQNATFVSALTHPSTTPSLGTTSLNQGNLDALQSRLHLQSENGSPTQEEQRAIRHVQKAAYDMGFKLSASTFAKAELGVAGWVDEQSRKF